MHIRITPKRPPVDKRQWHMWFAWRPVRVGGYIVWLEYVQRKGHRGSCFSDYLEWEYQPHDDVQISVQVFDEYAAEQRKQLEQEQYEFTAYWQQIRRAAAKKELDALKDHHHIV